MCRTRASREGWKRLLTQVLLSRERRSVGGAAARYSFRRDPNFSQEPPPRAPDGTASPERMRCTSPLTRWNDARTKGAHSERVTLGP